MKEIIKLCFSSLATIFIYLVGGIDTTLICLIIVMGLDYLTGLIKAYYKSELNSKIGIKGILKKLGMLGMVALSVVVEKLTGEHGMIRNLIIYYLVANEGLSIIENLAVTNIGIPDFLKEKLEQLRGDDK